MLFEFLQPLISLLQAYPFLFIFVGMLFAGETVLLPAIFLAVTGHLDLAAVISLAILATVLSDLAWYGLGRKFPATALARIPGRHSNNVVRGLERMFSRKGAQILFLSKFVYGTRTITQVLAGVHDMAFRTYIVVNFLGVLALSAALVAIAYSIVGSSRQLGDIFERLEIAFLLFVVIAVATNYLVSRLLRSKWSR
ncbi:membrane protein DedA with SNARE-associated domain [Natronocella acetinitrilica]|uniref:Membrane protein DedA with SNARE-associated domain n=1 Tax=Natronocella acetinitrilica TaxID=414046 RepID=A0AAE3G4W1_9GAMM|nr:VTT domain-containing protein [Natronocella acetinitrilica]MCP1675422.1 membrane protein DedA with SNARE-associated domain [Natronocella acetinitrilica]